MKRFIGLFVILAMVFGIVSTAMAAPELMAGVKIAKSEARVSKKGTQYHSLAIEKKAELNGIAYTETVFVNAFGIAAIEAAKIKTGETVDLVVEKNANGFINYKGHRANK